MRVTTSCGHNLAALLLVALLTIPFGAGYSQSNWDRYKPGTIAAIMDAHDTTVFPNPVDGKTNFMVSGDHFPTLASVIYTGHSRPLDPIRALVMRNWSLAFLRDTSMLNDFHREYLFREGKRAIWLPVQDTVASFFANELKAGQKATLYVMFLGAQRANGETVWAFAVNEFKAEPIKQ